MPHLPIWGIKMPHLATMATERVKTKKWEKNPATLPCSLAQLPQGKKERKNPRLPQARRLT